MRRHRISDETVRRLPVYLRKLFFLAQAGTKTISSSQLAEMLGTNAWQIRKDFSYFGDFGTRGVGYDIKKLVKQIKKILRLEVGHKVILVGVGNLGSAVMAYPGFQMYGLDIVAAFDNDPEIIGQKVSNITIEDVNDLDKLKKKEISLAIIAVPQLVAQQIVDKLVTVGVKGILNFSPLHLIVPSKIKLINIDIGIDLARLPYYIK